MTWPRALPKRPCDVCGHRRISHFTPQRERWLLRGVVNIGPPLVPCAVPDCDCIDYDEPCAP